MKLSDLQKAFCREYIIDFNATKAYIRAGYKGVKSANSNATRLMVNDGILAEIKRLTDDIKMRNTVKIDDVLAVMHNLLTFDIRDMYDKDGRLLQPHELPDNVALSISSFKSRRETSGQGEDRTVDIIDEYKTYDKTKTADMFMKHLGGYSLDKEDPSPQPTNIIYNVMPKTNK